MDSFEAGGVAWHVPSDQVGRLKTWLDTHFPSVLERDGAVLKRDAGRRVAAADGLVIKETTPRRARSSLRFGVRPSAARSAFSMGAELVTLGVSMPRPVAWATVRRCGLRLSDYLVTELIPDSYPLTRILQAAREHEDRKDAVIDGLAGLMASFHRNGFSNRDMKDGNILVTEQDGMRLWTVDLDGVRRIDSLTTRGVLRDFRSIVRSLGLYGWAETSDRARLAAAYNESVPEALRLDGLPGPRAHGK